MPFLVINIPGCVMPLERGERFEDPLELPFKTERIGATITGGGSSVADMGGRKVVTSCDIDLEVDDVSRALPVIRRVLIAQRAPEGTTIRSCEPDEIIYSLRDDA
jgi:hypothetical protein